jgi:hydroxymethylpyrimidine pyrophosphatase-like HAD family hydrolase
MSKYAPTKSIGIDIDGTLLIGGELNKPLIEWAKTKRNKGFDVVLWSARGRKYAEKVADRHQISDVFTAIIGKPGYIVDDLGWQWIKYTKVVKQAF